jgi:hypothetical protein
MNLYIEVENGVTKNHPAFEENLIQAFGEIPLNWEKFIRVDPPIPTVYQVLNQEPTYSKVDGVWTDVWSLRNMTDEEKLLKKQAVIDAFNNRECLSNWSAWAFDEATCTMQPPIPRPPLVQGVTVLWCGAENNWKEAPNRPVDGNQYKFDFFAWQWIEVVN